MFFPIDEELFFRLTLLALLIAYQGIRGYYERKVKATDPELRKKRLRMRPSRYERRRDILLQEAISIIWGIPVLVYIAYPPWRTWSAITFLAPIWFELPGLGLAVLSLGLLVWTHKTLGMFWTLKLEIRPKHELITWGPYSQIRHPMYAAIVFFMFATGIIAADWLILVISALNLLVVYKRIDGEEQMMLDHFGTKYEEYMQRTRRLLPRLRRE